MMPAMADEPEVLVSEAGEGERLRLPFGELLVRIPGDHTGGALSVVEMRLAPGSVGAAPHVHHGHQEYFVVREGVMTFDLGDASREVGPDGMVTVPRGLPHGFRNDTAQWVTAIGMFTPAGYEQYFRDVARLVRDGAEVTADVLATLRARYRTVPA
jgi:mannose-6-phosphate isomerase-like protein (cupin superfamily)